MSRLKNSRYFYAKGVQSLTGKKFRIYVDEEDYDRITKHKWQVMPTKNGEQYIRRTRCTRKKDQIPHYKTILLHREILGLVDESRVICVNHKDFDGCNNRKSNLQVCSQSQNLMWQRRRTTSKKKPKISEYKGVTKGVNKYKWVSQIWVKGTKIHLGSFDTEEAAARAYDEAAIQHFGRFAFINFRIEDKAE